ncbi:MAG: MazG family protein [Dehalococcoidia bacterium]
MLSSQPPHRTVEDLLEVVERLRDPGGCPWDRDQTHASLRPNLLEESYEVLEALDLNDPQALAEELGDLLVQVVFHADIARRASEWTLEDVVSRVVDKLVRRHPHVFDENGPELKTAEQVSQQWDILKSKEPGRNSITNGLPSGMPALAYAGALQRRAARAGLPVPSAVENDVDEATAGRQLFDAVASIQAAGIDPEVALRAETLKYRDRIRRAEDLAGGGAKLGALSSTVRSQIWLQAET